MNVGKVKRGLKSISNIFKTKNVITIKSTVSDFDLLNNKIVLITGGTGGIGKSIAIKMLECGAKVIVCGTNQNKINSLVNKVNNNNFKGMIINLNEIDKFDNKIKEAKCQEKLFGKINVLVNCAGIHSTKNLMDYLSITEDDYTKIMDTNLKGTYFISQSIAKYMISNKIKGHILNISSSFLEYTFLSSPFYYFLTI